MHVALDLIGLTLILGGLLGAIVPALPGIVMIFGGIWLIAAVDGYRHLGWWWLLGIGAIGGVGVGVDFVAAALGAKRIGASRQALWGASLGTLVGLFLGLPGLLFGPFIGALLGELSSNRSLLRSTHVGLSTWVGLLLGTLVKVVVSLTMVALWAAGWWWNRLPS